MGRRARNKQPPPEPLEPKVFLTSKKLGKRKADSDKGNSRPTKKIKDVTIEGKAKQKSPLKGKKKTVGFLSDEDDDMGGWEDVEDTVDLTTLKKLGN
jgi:ribosomal RNA methyltransferase Nop2